MSDALRWSPVASDRQSWLEATQQLRNVVSANLPTPNSEPYSKQRGVYWHAVAAQSLCAAWLGSVQQKAPRLGMHTDKCACASQSPFSLPTFARVPHCCTLSRVCVLPLPAHTDGVNIAGRSWSGLPCASWESFIAQERYPASYSYSTAVVSLLLFVYMAACLFVCLLGLPACWLGGGVCG